MEFNLIGFTVENLRGFKKAHLNLDRPITLLVGPNNSGKTSLLRLLEWSLTGVDSDLLAGKRSRRPDEDALLLPARNSQSRARRLTLHIQVYDGRRRSKFRTKRGEAQLRLRIVGDAVYAAVSAPRRSEPKESEPAAVDLWRELKEELLIVHVPAARDASSNRFRDTVSTAVRARLEERAIHDVRGGAPAEYRTLKSAIDTIRNVGDDLVAPLWADLADRLPSGLVQAGRFSFDASPEQLVGWMVGNASFRISTGDHDERTVSPEEVGSGLQSLLDLALLESVENLASNSLLLLEEPEAFLHPSAQRQVAQTILADRSVRRVISTHSPIVVDEARYGQVVLLRDHKIYEPIVRDEKRSEINSALMVGNGAEAIFAESVLFVEGPGDSGFFDALRRRIADVDKTGCAHRLGLVAVGSCTRFGPWISLMQSYADAQGELPVQWLAVADAVDATSELAQGLRGGGLTIPQDLGDLLRDTTNIYRDQGVWPAVAYTRRINALSEELRIRIALMPIDLEYGMMAEVSNETAQLLSGRLGLVAADKQELMRKLGSKVDGKPVSHPAKAEWMRAECGRYIPWTEISEDVKRILVRWLSGAMDVRSAEELVTSL